MKFLNNFVNFFQFNVRYETVERPAPMCSALVVTYCLLNDLYVTEKTS